MNKRYISIEHEIAEKTLTEEDKELASALFSLERVGRVETKIERIAPRYQILAYNLRTLEERKKIIKLLERKVK